MYIRKNFNPKNPKYVLEMVNGHFLRSQGYSLFHSDAFKNHEHEKCNHLQHKVLKQNKLQIKF